MIVLNGLAVALLAAATPAATPAARPTLVTPAQPPEKLTCRRYTQIGSLVKSKRVCHTKADWERIADGARRNTAELQDARNGTNGN